MLSWRLCPRKWLMLFSLKFQRNNQQNALAMDSAKGESCIKRLHFHRVMDMKQPHTMTEPKRIIIMCGMSHSYLHMALYVYLECAIKSAKRYNASYTLLNEIY